MREVWRINVLRRGALRTVFGHGDPRAGVRPQSGDLVVGAAKADYDVSRALMMRCNQATFGGAQRGNKEEQAHGNCGGHT